MSLRVISGDDANYTVVEKLGAGTFGAVYKVRRKSDGKVRVITSISPRIQSRLTRPRC